MIFKTGLQKSFLLVFAVLSVFFNCINDPSNDSWEPQRNFNIINDMEGIFKILCDKKGNYYGLTNDNVITFNKAALDSGTAPDTLAGSQDARDFFLDINDDLIVLQSNGAKRYRSAPKGYEVEDLNDFSFLNIYTRFVNMDKGIAMLASNPNKIISWDGVSFAFREFVHNYVYYEISGIFLHEEGLEIFVNSNYTLSRLVVDESSSVETKIPTAPFYVNKITKKWQTFIGEGFFKGAIHNTPVLFTISTQDSFCVIDTIKYYLYNFIETDNAIYLYSSDYVYRIDCGNVYSIKIDSEIFGPLFLDQDGRPAIFNRNTYCNIYLDNIDYDYKKRW